MNSSLQWSLIGDERHKIELPGMTIFKALIHSTGVSR